VGVWNWLIGGQLIGGLVDCSIGGDGIGILELVDWWIC
jgi:hypothetical protein